MLWGAGGDVAVAAGAACVVVSSVSGVCAAYRWAAMGTHGAPSARAASCAARSVTRTAGRFTRSHLASSSCRPTGVARLAARAALHAARRGWPSFAKARNYVASRYLRSSTRLQHMCGTRRSHAMCSVPSSARCSTRAGNYESSCVGRLEPHSPRGKNRGSFQCRRRRRGFASRFSTL